jgi:hypothetical protein
MKMKKSGALESAMAVDELSTESIKAQQIVEALYGMDQYTDTVQKHLSSLQVHAARLPSNAPITSLRARAEDAKRTTLEEARDRLKKLVFLSSYLFESSLTGVADQERR